jgi:ubiquinone biosynthesis protein
MRRTAADKIRENIRLQQVYNVFLRYGWDMLFERSGFFNDFRLGMQRWVWQLPPDVAQASTPVKARLMIEELGPTYVKMGQIASSQASVIPPEWELELERLQSEVPPFPIEQVRETIIEELGAPPEQLYATFNPVPLAAASTAQVHRATLFSGEEIVVKVQRPHIQQQMKADLGIMQYAAGVASGRSEELQSIDLVGMLEQFGSSVLDELDYNGESYNALRLTEILSDVDGASVPKMYLELCTSRILSIEFVRGVKISDLDAIDAAGIDREALASTALRAMIKQLLISGFFHADPHPGNVLVNLDTGDITFIDTGMVGELNVHQRVNVIQLLMALQEQDITAQAQILRNMSVPFIEPVDEQAYIHDFERKVGRFKYRTRVPFGEVINMAFDLLREHGLRLDPDLTMAIKALVQLESIASLLFPGGGIVVQGATIAREMVMVELDKDKISDIVKKHVTMGARDMISQLPTLQQATTKWLDQYKKGRFEVYVDTSGLTPHVNKVERMGRMVIIALLLVGMLIASSIASTVLTFNQGISEVWDQLFRVAYFGYLFSMSVAAIMVLRLIWRWLRGKDPVGD